jgi:hypothetical protein
VPTLKIKKSVNTDKKRSNQIVEKIILNIKNKAYANKRIPLQAINVLAQPRKTFDDITELSEGIAAEGLINPLTVARFDESKCREYLDVLNAVRKTDHCISGLHALRENGRERYYMLLGGERRIRSLYSIWGKGCAVCRKEYGTEMPGKCYKRHFKDNKIDIRYQPKATPLAAIFAQSMENTHKRVPIHEEAEEYNNFFRFLRLIEPKFPLAAFARRVGRSEDAVRNALRFCDLPENIQSIVKRNNGKFYGLAVEASRLFINGIDPEVAQFWFLRAIVEDKRQDDFRKSVSAYLSDINSGQISLFEIFEQFQEKDILRNRIKKIAAGNFITATNYWIAYCKRILELFESGDLGLDESPFSQLGPIKAYAKFLDFLDQLSPHLKKVAKRKFESADRPIIETRKSLHLFI